MLEIEVFSPVKTFLQCLVASLGRFDQFHVRGDAHSIEVLVQNLNDRLPPNVLLVDVASPTSPRTLRSCPINGPT